MAPAKGAAPAAAPRASALLDWRPTKKMNVHDLSNDDDFLSHLLVEKLGTGIVPLLVHKMNPGTRPPKTDARELLAIVQRLVSGKGAVHMLIKHAVDDLLALPGVRYYLRQYSPKQINAFATHASRYFEFYMPTGSIEISHTSRYSHRTGKSELCILATRPLPLGTILNELKGSMADLSDEEERRLEHGGPRSSATGIRKDFSVIHSKQMKKNHLFLGPARFVNHDCDNNVELFRDGRYITFRVIKPIGLGEEITTHYGDGYFGSKNKDCLCATCERRGRGGYAPHAAGDTGADSDADAYGDSDSDSDAESDGRSDAGGNGQAGGTTRPIVNVNERRTRRGVYHVVEEESESEEEAEAESGEVADVEMTPAGSSSAGVEIELPIPPHALAPSPSASMRATPGADARATPRQGVLASPPLSKASTLSTLSSSASVATATSALSALSATSGLSTLSSISGHSAVSAQSLSSLSSLDGEPAPIRVQKEEPEEATLPPLWPREIKVAPQLLTPPRSDSSAASASGRADGEREKGATPTTRVLRSRRPVTIAASVSSGAKRGRGASAESGLGKRRRSTDSEVADNGKDKHDCNGDSDDEDGEESEEGEDTPRRHALRPRRVLPEKFYDLTKRRAPRKSAGGASGAGSPSKSVSVGASARSGAAAQASEEPSVPAKRKRGRPPKVRADADAEGADAASASATASGSGSGGKSAVRVKEEEPENAKAADDGLPKCRTCANVLPVISVDSKVVWGPGLFMEEPAAAWGSPAASPTGTGKGKGRERPKEKEKEEFECPRCMRHFAIYGYGWPARIASQVTAAASVLPTPREEGTPVDASAAARKVSRKNLAALDRKLAAAASAARTASEERPKKRHRASSPEPEPPAVKTKAKVKTRVEMSAKAKRALTSAAPGHTRSGRARIPTLKVKTRAGDEPPRKRGRPRKHPLPETPRIPRPRGRPRKRPLTPPPDASPPAPAAAKVKAEPAPAGPAARRVGSMRVGTRSGSRSGSRSPARTRSVSMNMKRAALARDGAASAAEHQPREGNGRFGKKALTNGIHARKKLITGRARAQRALARSAAREALERQADRRLKREADEDEEDRAEGWETDDGADLSAGVGRGKGNKRAAQAQAGEDERPRKRPRSAEAVVKVEDVDGRVPPRARIASTSGFRRVGGLLCHGPNPSLFRRRTWGGAAPEVEDSEDDVPRARADSDGDDDDDENDSEPPVTPEDVLAPAPDIVDVDAGTGRGIGRPAKPAWTSRVSSLTWKPSPFNLARRRWAEAQEEDGEDEEIVELPSSAEFSARAGAMDRVNSDLGQSYRRSSLSITLKPEVIDITDDSELMTVSDTHSTLSLDDDPFPIRKRMMLFSGAPRARTSFIASQSPTQLVDAGWDSASDVVSD